MEEVEYWDSVAVQAKDNFNKRKKLLRYLLNYDFEDTEVLEIGTGLGTTATLLMFATGGTFKYIGTDISPKFCAYAKRMGLNMVNARSDNLPFTEKQFDSIFAFDVLEHISHKDRPSVFTELSRVLKRGGTVFINNPLSESKHDKNFDFGFSQSEIGKLSETLEAEIYEVKTYQGKGNYWYQFIVLRRAK